MTAPSPRPFAPAAHLPSPPVCPQRPSTATHHGVTLVDPYAWLRADNWQDVMRRPEALAADIRAHLEAENAHTEARMAGTVALQARLFDEMKARLKPDDSSVPSPDGGFAYYSRYRAGGQHPLLCRIPRDGGAETILLDGDAEAKNQAYWQLAASAHSPDHQVLAYAVDDKGSELATVRFRDLTTGVDLPDAIPDTRGSLVWANDARTLFYVKLDDNHRPQSVWRHRLGTPVEQDVLVYAEPDPGFFVGLAATQSSRLVTIVAHDHQTSEVHLVDADAPDGPLRMVEARRPGHEYGVEHLPGSDGGDLLILSNADGAEDFKICRAPLATPDMAHWREVVPHVPGRLILEMTAFADHMVRLEREDGLPRIVIREHATGAEHQIAFAEEAYSLSMAAGYEFDTTSVRFTYSSMTTPAETYDYDMVTRARTLRKRQEVPSGHDPADYVTRRIFAPAPDGEQVPISLLYRKGTPLDGSAPLLLYGYGAYGISMPAAFATTRLSLVDRGMIFAIAHVRGGKERGYRWYRDGKLDRKTNTFGDFIAAGRHLVATGFTAERRIVAQGGSAGGMLMGAVANMAPDLFLGIVADVPFVDVLNTMLDKDLPLTPPEYPEWGNPLADPQAFATIRSYSPYDNVTAQAYPHILAYGGLTDPRVTYWEPAKWVAKLRRHQTGDGVILLKINMTAGHGGASGRYEGLKEVAFDYAFALEVAGLATVGAAAAAV
jgi:oligopeptidase B